MVADSKVQLINPTESNEPGAHAVMNAESDIPVQAVAVDDDGMPTTSYNNNNNNNNKNTRDYYEDDMGCEIMLCGNTKVRRMSEGTNVSCGLCGNTYVDLSDCQFAPGTKLTLFSLRLCGDVQFIVPPGTRIVIRRLTLCGYRDVQVERPHPDDPLASTDEPPRVTITMISLCGNVRVRSDPDDMPAAQMKF